MAFFQFLDGLKETGLNILRLDSPHPNPVNGYFGCKTTEVTGSFPTVSSLEATEVFIAALSEAIWSKYSFEEQYIKRHGQVLTRRLSPEDESGHVH